MSESGRFGLCNICEAPAAGHWGCGPRCAKHQYDERETLEELRAKRNKIDRDIAARLAR